MSNTPTTDPTDQPSAGAVGAAKEIFASHISAPPCEEAEYVSAIARLIDRETHAKALLVALKRLLLDEKLDDDSPRLADARALSAEAIANAEGESMSPADLLPAQIADALKTREELIGILITADGKGKEVKTAALLDLLMRTIDEVRSEPTDPARIADGLRALCKRDGVYVDLYVKPCGETRFLTWEITPDARESHLGEGTTYEAAIEHMRTKPYTKIGGAS